MVKTLTPRMSSVSAKPPTLSKQAFGNMLTSHTARNAQWREKVAFLPNLGVTAPILKTMLKGSLSSTIAIAIYQSNSFAERYGTFETLVAIISILSVCTLPRVKFLQTLCLSVLGTCLACALSFLGLVLSTRARSQSESQQLCQCSLRDLSGCQYLWHQYHASTVPSSSVSCHHI